MEYDTLTFDGLHISLADLKKAIREHKRLGKTGEFHLQITDAQTKQGNILHTFIHARITLMCAIVDEYNIKDYSINFRYFVYIR